MLASLAIGTALISATVIIHTYGLIQVTHAMNWLVGRVRDKTHHRNRVLAMNTVVLGIFLVLTVEVWLWAATYQLLGLFPDLETALYFSTVTFSTVGYGDVIIGKDWRMLAALEAINGFLLIGWSTAYLISAGMRVGPFRRDEHF